MATALSLHPTKLMPASTSKVVPLRWVSNLQLRRQACQASARSVGHVLPKLAESAHWKFAKCIAAGSGLLFLKKSTLSAAIRQQGTRSYSTVATKSFRYVDVHCHLTHAAFGGESGEDQAVQRARDSGLRRVIVNGLDTESNRAVLKLCERHSDVLRPALGIYPLHASAGEIDRADFISRLDLEPPSPLDIRAELAFIDSMAAAGKLVAVGEAGLDKMYGYEERLLSAQEAVLRELCRIARKHNLPLILHSRAAEARVFQILQDEQIERADFHCYTGKKKLAIQIAEAGYYLSMPACITRNQQFQALAKALPMNRLLTETDAPYMAPDKDAFPNEPSNVPPAVNAIAKVRDMPADEVQAQLWQNYIDLFGEK
eukprot:TRINITY_DN16886_c0_g2_i1.p1 TRINITY_DN16886_c0_g2~~TRINITY_DN16886_c0_g2_i1.p1  ORF type:complete len:388 (+),score=62.67 TRINITY_DN16886_c0_g2_i1:49-1164(+)